MIALRFTWRAWRDLENIGDYIALENPLRAVSYTAELEQHCRLLAEFPHVGTRRRDLGRGIRILPHGPYLILYSVTRRRVEIRRIVHGARDLRRLF